MKTPGSAQLIIDAHLLKPASRTLVAAVLRVLPRWEYALAITCFGIGCVYLFWLIFVTHNIFWDINVYVRAVNAIASGVSPYQGAYPYNTFRYPPLVADAFYTLRWLFLTPTGRALLFIVHVFSWLSIPYLLAGSPKNWFSRDWLYVWGLYLVLFGLGGMRLLVVGNVAAVLFALTILSLVLAVRSGNYKLFWVTILLCSFVKFYFIVFLLFPIILDKRYLSTGFLIFALAALYALNYLLNPPLFTEYIAAITSGSADLGGAAGWSLFSLAITILRALLGPNASLTFVLGLGLQLLFSATILLFAYDIRGRRARPERFGLFCCWLFLSAFLISPRIFDYDLAVAIVPLVLLTRMLLIERGLGMVVATTVAASGTILLLADTSHFHATLSAWSGALIILGVWSGVAAHWLTSTRSDSKVAEIAMFGREPAKK
jgi:hypothetical protein